MSPSDKGQDDMTSNDDSTQEHCSVVLHRQIELATSSEDEHSHRSDIESEVDTLENPNH